MSGPQSGIMRFDLRAHLVSKRGSLLGLTLAGFYFLALSAFAQTCSTNTSNVSSLCITVSPTNPSPGSPLTVTANYCSTVNGTGGTEFIVALNSNAATIQGCPTLGQYFLVDV